MPSDLRVALTGGRRSFCLARFGIALSGAVPPRDLRLDPALICALARSL
jgi:hypothetical protein